MVGRTLPPPRRSGFTLVELLIVIGIIATLAGLLLVGITQANKAVKRSQASDDVQELAKALTTFKGDFGFYPPASFQIPAMSSDAGADLLRRMFRNFPPASPAVSVTFGTWPNSRLLDSNECLVFFLAGPGLQGWDPATPTATVPSASKKLYFDFPASKVQSINGGSHFVDPWKVPYAYLVGAEAVANPARPSTVQISEAVLPVGYPLTGSPVTTTVHHYYDSLTKPVNDTVQLISAGPDQFFGPGSSATRPMTTAANTWTPGTGSYAEGVKFGGYDDIGNFNGGTQLGFKK